jgi:hypothetical protein
VSTINFDVPYIVPSQLQKETTANQAFDRLDAALGSALVKNIPDANVALTDLEHDAAMYFRFTGALTAARTVTFKSRSRPIMVENATTGGQNVTIKVGSGAVTVNVPPAACRLLYIDAANNAVRGPFN